MISITVAGITLEGAEQPYPYPARPPRARVETIMLRPGQSAPGRRVVSHMGSDVSHGDLEFECRYLTGAHHASLLASFGTWPPTAVTVVLTDDLGSTSYSCSWAEDGYQPERTTYDPNRWRAKFKLHILSQS